MLSLVLAVVMSSQTPIPPVPSARQLAWHQLERYVFCHFGPNTFTGNEWGTGKESEQLFNPKRLDCLQWCRAFKAAGFRGVIITAKHHDGFCLWPSKFSAHTVAQSPWKDGKGDVLRELSAACRKTGLKFGVYLSPWDRNHPAYGTPAYNEIFKNMLREVLTHYGSVFEVWFDGANGEGPNGKKQVYDWPGFVQVVRACQPKAVIFSDAGPDIRWVGNEGGYAGETNWNFIDRSKVAVGAADTAVLNRGDEQAPDYVPAECDVSIRPGWFWKASEDAQVKTVDKLLDIWYGSVGRGANLLLNVPPNADGLIPDVDVQRLKAFNSMLEKDFAHEVKPTRITHDRPNAFSFEFPKSVHVNRIVLAEDLRYGQRIAAFTIGGLTGTTVGNRRVLRCDLQASKLALTITSSRGTPELREIRFFGPPAHAASPRSTQ